MSLDLYLSDGEQEISCTCECCGHEHTRKESVWSYSTNITHNLNKMAEAAGIYLHLWRPEELGITKAGELVKPLKDGVELLESDPDRFKAFDAKNGWGTYGHFVPFVRDYLEACEAHPDASVHASR